MGNNLRRLEGSTERSAEVQRTATILQKKGYHVTKVTGKQVSVIHPVSGCVIHIKDQKQLAMLERLGLISAKKAPNYVRPTYSKTG